MAKCGHCNHFGTKLEEISPSGGRYKMMAVCCSGCSAILGVTDYLNSGTLIKGVEKKVDTLRSEVGFVKSAVDQISNLLRRR